MGGALLVLLLPSSKLLRHLVAGFQHFMEARLLNKIKKTREIGGRSFMIFTFYIESMTRSFDKLGCSFKTKRIHPFLYCSNACYAKGCLSKEQS